MITRNSLFTLIYRLVLIASFLFASYLLYFGFWCLISDYASGDVGQSFNVFKYMYPFYLDVVSFIISFVILYNAFHVRKSKHFKSKTFSLLVIGIILNLVSYIIDKINSSTLNDIKPTIYYPIDINTAHIVSFFVFGFAILVLLFSKGIELKPHPFISTIKGIIYFVTMLLCMFFVGDLECIYFTFDSSLKNIMGVIPVYGLMILIVINFLVYELFKCKFDISLNNLTKKQYKNFFKYCVMSFLLTIIFFFWIYFYEKGNPNYLTESATAMFPVDHMLMHSKAYGIILLTVLNALPSLLAGIYMLFKKNKAL